MQDRAENELILVGQTKSSSTTGKNKTAATTRVIYCAVSECNSYGIFKCICDSTEFENNRANKCASVGFCALHGPAHSQHFSQMLKKPEEYSLLSIRDSSNGKAQSKPQAVNKKQTKVGEKAATKRLLPMAVQGTQSNSIAKPEIVTETRTSTGECLRIRVNKNNWIYL